MTAATQTRQRAGLTARMAQAAFIGIFFAPVAGALAGTLAETARYWNAEPNGTWLAPVLMGLSGGFLRGSITGLLLGIFNGWALGGMSLGHGTGVLFAAVLFASLLGAALLSIPGHASEPGAVNMSVISAFLGWIGGESVIMAVLLYDRFAARRKTS